MDDENQTKEGKSSSRVRSPKYPAFSLQKALERTTEFWDIEKRNAVPVSVAMKHWKYSPKSSGGLKAVAALITFGLLDTKGMGRARKVLLTDLAIRIVTDKRGPSDERDSLIKEAAIKPKIYREILDQFPNDLPSDESLSHYLINDKRFNDEAVPGFLKDFRDTLTFAKLSNADIIADENKAKDENQNDSKDAINSTSKHQDPLKKAPPVKSGVAQATLPLEEGMVLLQWPESLSATSLEDIESWLELLKRRVRRSVKNPDVEDTPQKD